MAQKPLDYDNPTTFTTTPSGIEIAYFTEPRRAYALRRGDVENLDTAPGADNSLFEWREVPSVTTILECLDKPALPWWGMKVGAIGVAKLVEKGIARLSVDDKLAVAVAGTWVYATEENLANLLNDEKLTVNHVKSDAGTRGQSAHDAFEAWATVGKIPDPSEYPQEERMYLEGLRKFCEDIGDAWTTESQEVAVASIEHGFAGRYDLRGKVGRDVKLVTRATTLKGEPLKKEGDRKSVIVPGGTRGLVDLKTSKGVYETHLMQLEGYEGASVECGYEPTDWRAVLHVTKDGLYEFKRARATYEDFLAILHTYRTLQSVKEALRS